MHRRHHAASHRRQAVVEGRGDADAVVLGAEAGGERQGASRSPAPRSPGRRTLKFTFLPIRLKATLVLLALSNN